MNPKLIASRSRPIAERCSRAKRHGRALFVTLAITSAASVLCSCDGDDVRAPASSAEPSSAPPAVPAQDSSGPPSPAAPSPAAPEPGPNRPAPAATAAPPSLPPATSSDKPPTIAGRPPASVVMGAEYDFRPSSNDPDGDLLTFSIVNRPAWATFDRGTGRLRGRPTLADLGRYANIAISVSDGERSAGLASFAVEVTATATGSIVLSWVPPTRREDGSFLTDLAGHRIYWGESPGDYSNSMTIDNPGITTCVIEDLSPASYYLVATSFDTEGIESEFSGVVNVDIP